MPRAMAKGAEQTACLTWAPQGCGGRRSRREGAASACWNRDLLQICQLRQQGQTLQANTTHKHFSADTAMPRMNLLAHALLQC